MVNKFFLSFFFHVVLKSKVCKGVLNDFPLLAPPAGVWSVPSLGTEGGREDPASLTMDAIKKKMQAMKVEKDNACDRMDVSEEAMKAARVGASIP